MKFVILAVLFAAVTANSYKPAEYAPEHDKPTNPAQPYSFDGETQYPEPTAPKYAKASPYTPVYSSPVYNAPAYVGLTFPAYKTPN